MVRRVLLILASLLFAVGVLATSVFRTTTVTYLFPQKLHPDAYKARILPYEEVDYFLAYPGILPDHQLWGLKVMRDRVWLFLTADPIKRAELLLLFADKRINAARDLLEKDNPGLAVSTATRAEKYLEEAVQQAFVAQQKGNDIKPLLEKLALASLKHREVLEEMYIIIPEVARPTIAEMIDSPKKMYNETKVQMIKMNLNFPSSPFEK